MTLDFSSHYPPLPGVLLVHPLSQRVGNSDDGIKGEDHERCMLGLGYNAARPSNELPEDDAGDSCCDASHCFWVASDDALERFSSRVPCSPSMGTISLNHSSSSWEGVFSIAGFRRNMLYGDERWGEFVRDGGTGVGSHRFGRWSDADLPLRVFCERPFDIFAWMRTSQRTNGLDWSPLILKGGEPGPS
jgi:hypothetical protein